MPINIQEIGDLIKTRLNQFDFDASGEEVGQVTASADGIVRIEGLPNAMLGEMIEFPGNVYGIALNLEADQVLAILLARLTEVKIGAWAKCTRKIMQVPVGNELLGRVVNALGEPIDGKGKINTSKFRPLEYAAPGVVERSPVDTPLQTGYLVVDALIPIGRGQRELIIGDRQTGKTTLAIDTIINQKGKNVICVYVSIGKKSSSIVEVQQILESNGAMAYSIIMDASADDPASMQFLAPFSGTAMAEEFMYGMHKDVLIIYDDLTRHANSYRMLSLLLQRAPGREAFPGDIFYLHSRLLERSAKLSKELGGGSITSLPVIETQKGDVSTYIPTNVISITDGQIFLQTDLFHSGFKPAVNAGISVSRVGGKAQEEAVRKLSGKLRLELARFKEKESFTAFASELDDETRLQLKRGQILIEILKQDKHHPYPVEEEVIYIYLATSGVLDAIEISEIKAAQDFVMKRIRSTHAALLAEIASDYKLPKDRLPRIESAIAECVAAFTAQGSQKSNG